MSRRTLIWIAIVLGVLVVGAGAYAWLGAGSAGLVPSFRLRSSEALWKAQRPADYEMKVSIGCFCPFFDRLPLTVQVRGEQVVSVQDSRGIPVAPDDPIRSFGNDQFLTVEGVFEYARKALREADQTTIEYDTALGYPTLVSVDWIRMAADDELSVTITGLRPLP